MIAWLTITGTDEVKMDKQNTSLEIIAASVEEAIEKGLSELGLSAEAVVVDILDTGTKGLFGLGSRLARVKLTVKKG
jgi:spoIIIJ-associated protein